MAGWTTHWGRSGPYLSPTRHPAAILVTIGFLLLPLGEVSSGEQLAATAPVSVGVWETTNNLADRLTRVATVPFTADVGKDPNPIPIDPRVTYQPITGFGAAMT